MKAYIVESAELRKNLDNIKKRAGSAVIYAVLKGNGYGLGLIPMAAACRDAGITRYAVTEVSDVAALRQCGFPDEEILMLRPTADSGEVRQLLALNAVFTVSSQEDAAVLNGVASQENAVAKAHIKIDTGMGRYGFLPEDMDHILGVYREQKNIAVSGVYTHFNCAFGSKKLTHQEFETFRKTVSAIREAGFETGTVHCCNSSAFLRFPEMHCDGVRLGSAILGRVPFHTKLRPVGYAEAHVEELRILPKGHPTGYGAMWTAREDTPVAIVPIGWYNGFRERCDGGITRFRDCLSLILRGLRGIFFRALPLVEVNGHKCRVVGQIGMLHIAVDVRGIECKPGDRVIVPINPLHVKGMKIQYR